MEQQWLFSGGPPRSGTTILAWCLKQHPDIAITGETHMGTDIVRILASCDESGLLYAPNLPHHIRLGRLLSGQHGPDAYELAAGMAAGVRSVIAPDATYFGDKSPQYARDWPMLRNIFPDCKLIFTDRDTEACAESIIRQDWGAETLEKAVSVVERFRAEMSGCKDAYRVQLEELNAEPRKVISELLDWLDLDDEGYPWDAVVKQVVEPEKKIN